VPGFNVDVVQGVVPLLRYELKTNVVPVLELGAIPTSPDVSPSIVVPTHIPSGAVIKYRPDGKNTVPPILLALFAAIASNAFNYYLHNVLSIVPSQMSDYASFDSRVHNLPYEEIENYFIWRQQDATRNSIQMYGQFFFPHKQLQGVSCDALQGKMLLEKDFNWNDVPTWQKRGSVVTKDGTWDMEIPIFTQQREWIMSQSL